MSELYDILPDNLKYMLNPAERKLLSDVSLGRLADFSVGDEEEDNPKNSGIWGPKRTIRASVIGWLCTDEEAKKRIPPFGVKIWDAKVDGELDLWSARFSHILGLH
jgi:hypothetical protein